MTFGDEICEIAEAMNTYMTGELNWALKKSKTVFKLPGKDDW